MSAETGRRAGWLWSIVLAEVKRRRATIRNGLLYDKGPILPTDLHKQVGDEAFLAFLRSCQTTLGWKFGTTKEIARLLQAAAGRDFGTFFDS